MKEHSKGLFKTHYWTRENAVTLTLEDEGMDLSSEKSKGPEIGGEFLEDVKTGRILIWVHHPIGERRITVRPAGIQGPCPAPRARSTSSLHLVFCLDFESEVRPEL